MFNWIRQKIINGYFGIGSAPLANNNEMKPETTENQIKRLETKVNFLTRLSIAQTAALGILLVLSLMPSTSTFVMVVFVAIAFVAVFHRFLPTWAGWAGRAIGSMLRDKTENESTKESF